MTAKHPIHPLVTAILETRRTELPDGSVVEADSFVGPEECDLIYRTIESSGATRAVEIGMAHGISSLCIADALARHAPSEREPRLVSIDPVQSTDWRGSGVHLLRRAALRTSFTLIEEKSEAALPRLQREGFAFDFALIDGWHTFDHTLVDFFHVDLLLAEGGVVVFDDVGYPAIRRVVEFVLSNRDYELVEAVGSGERVPRSLRIRRSVKRLVQPIARTDRDPSRASRTLFRKLDGAYCAALRKRGHDRRRFDHFEPF